ncbi:hypothetical protein [Agrococcus sp. KRD186]|nr:hypothetical protein [Agrococcus sp. KRD186]
MTKYTRAVDFSPVVPVAAARPGSVVLAGLESVIQQWLGDDERRPRKQRK